MANPMGRPSLYEPKLHVLKDDELYTPAMVTSAIFNDLEIKEDVDPKVLRVRVRHAMARRAKNFSTERDGIVLQHNKGLAAAFFGWRWKGNPY